jgi:hypothetical protein
MLKRAILIVQNHLKANGMFAANPDGAAGPITDAAVIKGLTPRTGELPAGALSSSPKRRMTMMLQLIAKDKGIAVEPIDGFWGPVTQNAYDSLVHLIDNGTVPPNWRDEEPSDANPNKWPRDRGNQAEMKAFFGTPGNPPMQKVRCPWKLKLAWDKSTTMTHVGVHAKVADSVGDVFEKVHAHYGEAELKRLRLDLFGGCYFKRKKRGGSTWSTHAWAIALDWDPERNQLKWGRDKASLDASAYDFWWRAWEKEGWVSLGRSRNYDWMHVQAARL